MPTVFAGASVVCSSSASAKIFSAHGSGDWYTLRFFLRATRRYSIDNDHSANVSIAYEESEVKFIFRRGFREVEIVYPSVIPIDCVEVCSKSHAREDSIMKKVEGETKFDPTSAPVRKYGGNKPIHDGKRSSGQPYPKPDKGASNMAKGMSG